jgi:hypothetical protein
VFAGYAGWVKGSWRQTRGRIVVDAVTTDTFTDHPDVVARVRRQRDPLPQFANYPPDVSVN